MENIYGELDASIQAKLEEDTDFQVTLAGLSDEEKEQAISTRKSEEMNKELASLKEESEKAKKAQELADNYKIRAEKAEKELKGSKVNNPEPEQSLTPKDTLALVDAKVSSEDIEEVTRVAKILGKPIAEALKDKTMQTILSERVEERKSAEIAQTGKNQRGVSKVTGADLLDKAEKTGEMPEDEDGMRKIFQAKMARKVRK